jgi:hypothetical protein
VDGGGRGADCRVAMNTIATRALCCDEYDPKVLCTNAVPHPVASDTEWIGPNDETLHRGARGVGAPRLAARPRLALWPGTERTRRGAAAFASGTWWRGPPHSAGGVALAAGFPGSPVPPAETRRRRARRTDVTARSSMRGWRYIG